MNARSLLLAVLLGLPVVASAHKASDAYLTLAVDGSTITQRLDVALRDLDRDLVLDTDNDGLLQWREVVGRWSEIDRLTADGLALSADGAPCTAGPAGPPALETHSDGRHAVVTRTWRCAGAVRQLDADYRLFARTDPTHRGIVRWSDGPRGGTAVLVPDAGPRVLVDAVTPPAGWGSLFREGVHHILIGTDHVLFLLTLLLPAVLVRTPPGWAGARAWRPVLAEVVQVVTAFTVAHSVTLGLAVFGVVDPPSRWVESLIAASVVLAAVNNLVPVVRHGRWKLTFLFGLVHGFGFAGALKALGLADGLLAQSLLAFNLGVEAGQLAIVAVFLPLAWALRDTVVYRRGLLPAASVSIALLAAVWLAERALDLSLLPSA